MKYYYYYSKISNIHHMYTYPAKIRKIRRKFIYEKSLMKKVE